MKKLLRMQLPRLSGWMVAAACGVLIVWLIAPQQLSVIVYKGVLLMLAGVGGYWFDRSLFPYARPHDHFVEGHHAIGVGLMLRRAVIVGAAMLSVGLAL